MYIMIHCGIYEFKLTYQKELQLIYFSYIIQVNFRQDVRIFKLADHFARIPMPDVFTIFSTYITKLEFQNEFALDLGIFDRLT